MTLTIENLKCFAEAARKLNFRMAARAVFLSPAALGQRIRQLEDELQVQLFHRTTRAVVLTEAGWALLPYAEQALSSVENCRRVGAGGLLPAPVELTLGTRHELGMSWLVPLLNRLEDVQAGLKLHMYFGSGVDLLGSVRSVAIDCAVTSTRIADPKLDALNLHEESYGVVASATLLRKQPLTSVKDAKKHELLDVSDDLPLFRYLRDAPGGFDSLQFGRVTRLGTIAAIRHQVLRGEGVAVLPEYFVAQDLKSRRLIRVFPKIQMASDFFRLVFRADDPKRSLYVKLAEFLKSQPLR